MKTLTVLAAGCTAGLFSVAQAAVLTTGSGDGSVTIDVDAFGTSRSAVYDPVGDLTASDTFFDSFIAFGLGGDGRERGAGDVTVLEESATRFVSRFTIGDLAVTLTQSVSTAQAEGVATGSTFTQTFSLTNTADADAAFDVVRYLDGDLRFDGTISDGGGVIEVAGNRVVYETDAAIGADAEATFVGILTTGGNAGQGNFELDRFSSLRGTVNNGDDLTNTVRGDTDDDGFIDQPYDVELGLQDFFSLAAGDSAEWTTTTLFGNAVPPAPGSSEALPLLPTTVGGETDENAFFFEIDPATITEFETVFIDPVVAVGYTYDVTGASFASVTAPSFDVVPDPDGYLLTFDDGSGTQTVALAAGEVFAFSVPLSSFTIEGIDPALMIDPDNVLGFVTGVALTEIGASTIVIRQAPIEFDTDAGTGDVVPLPAAGWLMGAGLAGLYGARRQARR